MSFNPVEVIGPLSQFTGTDLTQTIRHIEAAIPGIMASTCMEFIDEAGAHQEAFAAATKIKCLTSQIDVTIHALGILLCLPHILEQDERVEYVSLGAGNTGRKFDLETNLRVAEFKFISWRGGPESIRQNQVFKDFFMLAESETPKQKFLYLLGTHHALKFLTGRRSLQSVLSRNNKIKEMYFDRFGDRFKTVSEYFKVSNSKVQIEDVSSWLLP